MDYATQNLAYVENFIKMMNSASEMRNRGNQNLLQGMGMLTDVGTKYGLQKGEQDFQKEMIGKTVTTPGIPAPPETISQTETKTIPGVMNYPTGMTGMPTQGPSTTETTTKDVPNPKFAEWQDLLKQGKISEKPTTTFVPGSQTAAQNWMQGQQYERVINQEWNEFSNYYENLTGRPADRSRDSQAFLDWKYGRQWKPEYGDGSDKDKKNAMSDLDLFIAAATKRAGAENALKGTNKPDPYDPEAPGYFYVDRSDIANKQAWIDYLKGAARTDYGGSMGAILNTYTGTPEQKQAQLDKAIEDAVNRRWVQEKANPVVVNKGNGLGGLFDNSVTISKSKAANEIQSALKSSGDDENNVITKLINGGFAPMEAQQVVKYAESGYLPENTTREKAEKIIEILSTYKSLGTGEGMNPYKGK